jgi:hypothetical protein
MFSLDVVAFFSGVKSRVARQVFVGMCERTGELFAPLSHIHMHDALPLLILEVVVQRCCGGHQILY